MATLSAIFNQADFYQMADFTEYNCNLSKKIVLIFYCQTPRKQLKAYASGCGQGFIIERFMCLD